GKDAHIPEQEGEKAEGEAEGSSEDEDDFDIPPLESISDKTLRTAVTDLIVKLGDIFGSAGIYREV
ncbi:hypothetical protein KIPB_017233, partial [Kipferlia bialata]